MPAEITRDADEVQLGAGLLYVAAVDVTDPVTVGEVTGSSAYREVGYTDDGSVIDISYTNEKIMVEEEFYPVRYVTTEVENFVGFNMKQASRRNLALAINLGANEANDGSVIEPPDPGEEVRVKIVHVSDAGALWVFRRCFQGDAVSISRQKAPNVSTLPVKFRVEKPDATTAPWSCYPTDDGLI